MSVTLFFTPFFSFSWLLSCKVADRGDVQKGSAEVFFRKVKFWKEDGKEEAPPVFVGISGDIFMVLSLLLVNRVHKDWCLSANGTMKLFLWFWYEFVLKKLISGLCCVQLYFSFNLIIRCSKTVVRGYLIQKCLLGFDWLAYEVTLNILIAYLLKCALQPLWLITRSHHFFAEMAFFTHYKWCKGCITNFILFRYFMNRIWMA